VPTIPELLSPAVRQQETQALAMLNQAGMIVDRPVRIGETGSGACNGNAPASGVFASALWALDWSLRAASSGVVGLSFHGHFGLCGAHNQSPICAYSNEAARIGNLSAQPVYYGLLAARQLEGGRFVPTRLIARELLPDLTTWATVNRNGTVRIAIDNLATTGLAQPIFMSIKGYVATEEALFGPSSGARGGIDLGGASVTSKAQWQPRLAAPIDGRRSLRVVVHPASAVIVTLYRKHGRG
jgi:hypothetical protein